MDADTYGKESNKKSKTITTICGENVVEYIYIILYFYKVLLSCLFLFSVFISIIL